MTYVVIPKVPYHTCSLGYLIVANVAARTVDESSVCQGIDARARRSPIITMPRAIDMLLVVVVLLIPFKRLLVRNGIVGVRNKEVIVADGFLSLCPETRVMGGRECEGEGNRSREKQQKLDSRAHCDDDVWHGLTTPQLLDRVTLHNKRIDMSTQVLRI